MKINIEIETPRLAIAEFAPEMTLSVRAASLDSDNREFMCDEVFETEETARAVVEYLISRYGTADGPFVYPVLLRSGDYLGHVEAVAIDRGWEVGYHIAEAYTGRGYATEALSAFVPFIMDKLGISTLYGICRADNAASRRVLEKCGFTLVFDGIGSYHGTEKHIRRYELKR